MPLWEGGRGGGGGGGREEDAEEYRDGLGLNSFHSGRRGDFGAIGVKFEFTDMRLLKGWTRGNVILTISLPEIIRKEVIAFHISIFRLCVYEIPEFIVEASLQYQEYLQLQS